TRTWSSSRNVSRLACMAEIASAAAFSALTPSQGAPPACASLPIKRSSFPMNPPAPPPTTARGRGALVSLCNIMAMSKSSQAAARSRRWPQKRPVSAPSLYGSCFPFLQMLLYKCVVVQVGVHGVYPVDLLRLAGAEHLVRVQAPGTGHQALPAQHLVHTGDTAGKIVGGVKKRPVAVGDGSPQRQQPCRNVPAVPVLPQFLVQLHHPAG